MEEHSYGRLGLHGAVVGKKKNTREVHCTEHKLFLFPFLLVVNPINFCARSQKCENRLIASSRFFVSLFSRNNSGSAIRIFIKFYI